MVLIFWAPSGLADVCKERTIRLSRPMFPRTHEELQTLKEEKSCSIDVGFSINENGRAENIDYRALSETCQPFNVSAIRAIRSSVFDPGPYVNFCILRVTFELLDGEYTWRYD
jgi:hypothetical protein